MSELMTITIVETMHIVETLGRMDYSLLTPPVVQGAVSLWCQTVELRMNAADSTRITVHRDSPLAQTRHIRGTLRLTSQGDGPRHYTIYPHTI